MKQQFNKKKNNRKPRRNARSPRTGGGRLIVFDGVVGNSPKDNRPDARASYVDTDIDITSVSTTLVTTSVLQPYRALLIFAPQICKLVAQGSANTPMYFSKIRVTGVDLNLNVVGGEGNPLTVADHFNRLRFILYDTEYPMSATVIPSWDIDSMHDFRSVLTSHFDHVTSLSAPAYDVTDVNLIPATENIRAHIPLNYIYEFVSTTTAGGLPTAFDTRMGNLAFAMVSDSSVAPHPSISGSVRLHFVRLDQ